MKTFNKVAFQGDVSIIRADTLGVTKLPDDVKEVKPEQGRLIVTHSETGHDHFVASAEARFYETSNPNICFLRIDGEHADLIHNRSVDQHQTIRIPSGLYQINKQTEKRPSGWERVVD